MEKQCIVESILVSIMSDVEQFVLEESEITSSFDYEERVVGLTHKFAKDLVLKSRCGVPKSRNFKKVVTTFGRVSIAKDYILCNDTSKFGINERLRVNVCLLGQSLVYEQGSQLLNELTGVSLSGMPDTNSGQSLWQFTKCFDTSQL